MQFVCMIVNAASNIYFVKKPIHLNDLLSLISYQILFYLVKKPFSDLISCSHLKKVFPKKHGDLQYSSTVTDLYIVYLDSSVQVLRKYAAVQRQ